MKTRIISGIVMVLIVAAFLIAGQWLPAAVTVLLAALNAFAAYEMAHNAVGVKDKASLAGIVVYSVAAVFSFSGYGIALHGHKSDIVVVTVIFSVFAACMCLKNHKNFTLKEIFAVIGMPMVLSYAFGCLEATLNREDMLFHLLLLINFSSVCDAGAYFVGVTLGKTKLCPEISPKKTVEGALGGIASGLVMTLILTLCFGRMDKLIVLMLLTVPFCILGMIGDLFFSVIKRAAGIKDYGTLIPGHGGILDRLDSILMIAPVLYMLIGAGVL